ncbi:hypothetical protein KP509_15G012700 [Ceratopteris richardii]|uniref:Pyrrolo-quinoline quinone repeat domain-containing protein n=5 Tax=Ceratopteris richardii TaxID=49495 RepID=A0A8T2T210_CERRI|nr:hypothetical protein KP509_15G012700 [Ceratopteris richardii]
MKRNQLADFGSCILLVLLSIGPMCSDASYHGCGHANYNGYFNTSIGHHRCRSGSDSKWVNHGNGLKNQRRAKDSVINRNTVSSMTQSWTFPATFDVTATPAIADGAIYFPAWDGMLYALNEKTGELLWRTNLLAVANASYSTGARATPTIWGRVLLIGLQGPASVVSVDRSSGAIMWISPTLDDSPYAVITTSGTVYDGYMYVGISSLQEVFTCCTFQGSFLKISASDGSVVWRTLMVPPNSNYTGVAVWGSSPAIDRERGLVYIATGNNYDLPDSVEACEAERLQNATISPDTCQDPRNHVDSMLALNIDDGAIAWSRRLEAYDVWRLECQLSPDAPGCPDILGQDYDFGEAPMLIYLDRSSSTYGKQTDNVTCIAVAGQKSGVVWALDCDTGSIVWSTAAGPGGTLGGAIWGSCTDGERVYTNIANNERRNFTLAPSNETTNGGGWVGMDAATGEVLWTTAEPSGGYAFGPLSVSDGVVFATSYTSSGDVYALDGLTGAILWHGTTGAGIYGGVSISRDCIFVGNGYEFLSLPTYNGTGVFAFCLKDGD